MPDSSATNLLRLAIRSLLEIHGDDLQIGTFGLSLYGRSMPVDARRKFRGKSHMDIYAATSRDGRVEITAEWIPKDDSNHNHVVSIVRAPSSAVISHATRWNISPRQPIRGPLAKMDFVDRLKAHVDSMVEEYDKSGVIEHTLRQLKIGRI